MITTPQTEQAEAEEQADRGQLKDLEAFLAQLKSLAESPAWAAVHDHLMECYRMNHQHIASANDERTIVWHTKVNEGLSYAMQAPSILIARYQDAIATLQEELNDSGE